MPPQGQPQGPYGAPQSYPPAPPPQSYPPQAPAPNPNDPGRYDFFMSPQQSQKRSLLPTGGGFGMKIGMLVGGAVLLMVIVGIVMSFIPSGLNEKELTALAKSQNEVLRICTDAAGGKAQDSATREFAQTCQMTVTSRQQELLAYTGKHGLKLTTKSLAKSANAQSTRALAASVASSSYDQTFVTIMKADLNKYVADLQAAFKTAKSAEQKALLQNTFADEKALAIQLKDADTTSP